MIILLDTSTPVCYLTIISGDQKADFEWSAGRELSVGLLKFLEDKLSSFNANINDISGIGVMKGPGSFTGLRIGLTVANTIADGLNVPIVGEAGEDWKARAESRLADGQNDQIVLPEYGAEAHITVQKK